VRGADAVVAVGEDQRAVLALHEQDRREGLALAQLCQLGRCRTSSTERLGTHPTFVGRVERWDSASSRWNTAMRFLRTHGADLRQLADAIDRCAAD
jgi:hypothetical protein